MFRKRERFHRATRKAILVFLGVLAAPLYADETIPKLKDVTGTASYEIAFIENYYQARITFDTDKGFFLVGPGDIRKFGSTGRERVKLPYKDIIYRVPFSPYVVTKDAVLDLSRDDEFALPITQVLGSTAGKRFKPEYFQETYSKIYNEAEIVFYAKYDSRIRKYPAYLRINGDWVQFNIASSNIDVDRDLEFGLNVAQFPAKFKKMILLADPVRGQYSHDSTPIRLGEVSIPERAVQYSRKRSLSLTSYKTEFVSSELAYTSIPIQKAGSAVHQIDIDGETLRFKEIATRDAFKFKVETNLSLYTVPAENEAKIPVSFLEFNAPVSNVTMGSDGLYIIRPGQ